MVDNKITIFDILARIDIKDTHFYDDLPEAVQKAEHPLVLMKWMHGTNDPLKVMMLNEMVNPYVFSLHKHKPLVMKMLTICASGNRTRYKWIKMKKGSTVKYPALIDVIKRTFNYSTAKALDVLPLISDADLLAFCEQLGFQKDEYKNIKKEIRLRNKQ